MNGEDWNGFSPLSRSFLDFREEMREWTRSTLRLEHLLVHIGFEREDAVRLAFGLPYKCPYECP